MEHPVPSSHGSDERPDEHDEFLLVMADQLGVGSRMVQPFTRLMRPMKRMSLIVKSLEVG